MPEILYRKWRPRSFGELAGQDHVAKTLTNALSGGRVAHAYLFAGPRGTGKTSTGRVLAKALNCKARVGGEPCNACESCLDFLSGRAMDLIELDAASNRGIDEIRSLRDKVAFAPGAGEFKVYLIDEVHMLTDAAFNALLKTLEEPPPHVVFILATTEAHRLPPTIASRCQRFDFRRIPVSASVERLQTICEGEGVTCQPEALELIARAATGSLRDATNLLDQLATSYGNDLTVEHVRAGLGLIGDERAGKLARLALSGDLAGGLELIASVRDDGLDLRQFQRELVDELRALLLAKSGLDPADGVTDERRRELRETVAGASTAQVLTALRSFGEADLKQDPNSTLPLDIALAECALGTNEQTGKQANGQGATARQEAARPAPDTSPARPEVLVGRAGAPTPETPRPAADVPPRDWTKQAPETPRPAEDVPSARPEPAKGALEGRDSPSSETPPQTTVPASGPVAAELDAAREQMRPIYEAARAKSVPLGALIGACDMIEVDETTVVLGFRHSAHADKASQSLSTLQGVVSEVMGRSVTVRCIHEPNAEDWMKRDSASRNRLVRAAQEMGARVLSSEPSEGEPA
ncbi:MAG TPA: DNA polymerase III subunit gamma/tau [Dehalococcoidia bacterium]|nr:DNA polymerase III subunit gamma/tau [Dehalococcoidia bacterium]